MAAGFGRWLAAAVLLLAIAPVRSAGPDVAALVPRLVQEGRELQSVPFAEVVRAATGKNILRVDPVADAAWLGRVSRAVERSLAALNAHDSAIRGYSRINEASRAIEDRLMAELNAEPGWICDIPQTAAGTAQRSGYPDLRLVMEDGAVVYLDPKLYDSPESTLRTFYFEPKTDTNKIHDDARHLLVAIRHNEKTGAALRLVDWQLIDVSRLRVRLKAEFQASNKDMYQAENIVARGAEAGAE